MWSPSVFFAVVMVFTLAMSQAQFALTLSYESQAVYNTMQFPSLNPPRSPFGPFGPSGRFGRGLLPPGVRGTGPCENALPCPRFAVVTSFSIYSAESMLDPEHSLSLYNSFCVCY